MTRSRSRTPRSSSAAAEARIGLDRDLGLGVLVARDRGVHARDVLPGQQRVAAERRRRPRACGRRRARRARPRAAARRRRRATRRARALSGSRSSTLTKRTAPPSSRARAHAGDGALELVCARGDRAGAARRSWPRILPEQRAQHAAQLLAARRPARRSRCTRRACASRRPARSRGRARGCRRRAPHWRRSRRRRARPGARARSRTRRTVASSGWRRSRRPAGRRPSTSTSSVSGGSTVSSAQCTGEARQHGLVERALLDHELGVGRDRIDGRAALDAADVRARLAARRAAERARDAAHLVDRARAPAVGPGVAARAVARRCARAGCRPHRRRRAEAMALERQRLLAAAAPRRPRARPRGCRGPPRRP